MSGNTRSHKIRKLFLDQIERGYSPSRAAKAAGEHLRFFNEWKSDDSNFAQDWEDAIERGSDRLEDVATKRAIRGSDGLLTTMLKARRPEKFREKQGEVNVKVQNDFGNIDEDLKRKIDRALKEDSSGADADKAGGTEPEAKG